MIPRMRISVAFALAAFAGLLLASASSFAETIQFKADLSGANEVPPTPGSGKGKLTATYNSTSKTLTYTIEYSGLSGPATAAHFHGPSDATHNAPVMIPVTGALASPMKGSLTFTDEQAAALTGGRLYFNIHTAKNKPGEIRGQILKSN